MNLCSRLGHPICPTFIEIKRDDQPIKPLIKTPAKIFYHNDDLGVELIAWYCVCETQYNEPVLIMDSHLVLKELTMKEKEALKEIFSDSETEYFCPDTVVPIIQNYGLYFPPLPMLQGTMEKTPKNELAPLYKVYEILKSLSAEQKNMEFLLKTGQVLIIDNRRFLHSRSDLYPDSKRRHLRVWVNERV